jgi:hypothetical protein
LRAISGTMAMSKIHSGLYLLVAALLFPIAALASPVNQAGSIDIIAGAPGQMSPDDTAATVLTFDDLSLGSLGAGYSFAGGTLSGDGTIESGTNAYAAAPAGDASHYLSASGANLIGATTLSLTAAENYLGLYWGSLDSYNSVAFYLGDSEIAAYSGADIADLLGLDADGDQQAASSNAYVNFYTGAQFFDRVVFSTTSHGFELDTLAFADPPPPTAVPGPASLPILAAALTGLGLACTLRRGGAGPVPQRSRSVSRRG